MQATLKRLILIDKLISLEETGTPQELADRLKLSKSQLHNIIKELKSCGVPIAYNKGNQSYYYTDNFDLSTWLETLKC
jgi:predicted DNA-binding transcriptional regulator YafY